MTGVRRANKSTYLTKCWNKLDCICAYTHTQIFIISFYYQVVEQLDDEYNKHAADTAQGDDVTYMLEKERERLQLQV